MAQKDTGQKSRTPRRGGRGFSAVSGLVDRQVRRSGESRGFAVMRLLTQWPDIVGAETAGIATPVKVTYARDGFGATLIILTNGANAPMLQADLPRIKERVNACYGYNAISRIRITQTAPTGFHEGQRSFDHAPVQKTLAPSQEVVRAAAETVKDVDDSDLKNALQRLTENVLQRSFKPQKDQENE